MTELQIRSRLWLLGYRDSYAMRQEWDALLYYSMPGLRVTVLL